jgi:hypothetical protein
LCEQGRRREHQGAQKSEDEDVFHGFSDVKFHDLIPPAAPLYSMEAISTGDRSAGR